MSQAHALAPLPAHSGRTDRAALVHEPPFVGVRRWVAKVCGFRGGERSGLVLA